MSLDLAIPLRDAIMASAALTGPLGTYENEPAVFTRRPVPKAAQYPLIWIGPNAAGGDENFLNTRNPMVMRDVGVSGEVGAPGHPDDQYRTVESLAFALWDYFDDRKDRLTVPGFNVLRISARPPIVGPSDDERHLTRVVMLSVRLSETT